MKRLALFCALIAGGLHAGGPLGHGRGHHPGGRAHPPDRGLCRLRRGLFQGREDGRRRDQPDPAASWANSWRSIRFDSKEFAPRWSCRRPTFLCGQKKVAAVFAGLGRLGPGCAGPMASMTRPSLPTTAPRPRWTCSAKDPAKYYNIYQTTDVGINQAASMFKALMALPYEYPNKKAVIINSDDSWGDRGGRHPGEPTWKRPRAGRSPSARRCPTAPMSGAPS